MKKIKGVIFDLDGTLANTLPLCISAFRKSIEPLINRDLSDQEIIATFGPSEEGTIMALAAEHYEKGIADYLYYYKSLHAMCPNVFEGISDLLLGLKNRSVRIAMVTGKGKYSTDISLDYFGVRSFFEPIETGSPLGPRKAEGIRCVLEKWQHPNKDETIYVGDAPGDILASREVGINVIAAAWAQTAEVEKLEKSEPDKLFCSVTDFSNWLLTRI